MHFFTAVTPGNPEIVAAPNKSDLYDAIVKPDPSFNDASAFTVTNDPESVCVERNKNDAAVVEGAIADRDDILYVLATTRKLTQEDQQRNRLYVLCVMSIKIQTNYLFRCSLNRQKLNSKRWCSAGVQGYRKDIVCLLRRQLKKVQLHTLSQHCRLLSCRLQYTIR